MTKQYPRERDVVMSPHIPIGIFSHMVNFVEPPMCVVLVAPGSVSETRRLLHHAPSFAPRYWKVAANPQTLQVLMRVIHVNHRKDPHEHSLHSR